MGQAMSGRQRLEERNLPVEQTETEMALRKRLSELDGLIEELTANLHGVQNWRNKLAAQIADPPQQNGYPVTQHQRIARIVPAVTDISWDRIRGRQRDQKVVNARWLAINMLTESNYSLAQIGRFLNKDHTTIWHAKKGWPKLYVTDLAFQKIAHTAWHQFYRERL